MAKNNNTNTEEDFDDLSFENFSMDNIEQALNHLVNYQASIEDNEKRYFQMKANALDDYYKKMAKYDRDASALRKLINDKEFSDLDLKSSAHIRKRKDEYSMYTEFKEQREDEYYDYLQEKGANLRQLEQALEEEKDEEKRKVLDEQIEREKAWIQESFNLEHDQEEELAAFKEKNARKAWEQRKARARKEQEEEQRRNKANIDSLFGKGTSFGDKKDAFESLTSSFDPDTGEATGVKLGKVFAVMTKAIGDLTKSLEPTMKSIAQNQSKIDTRLQGSKMENWSAFGATSHYWDGLSDRIVSMAAISPYFTQQKLTDNLNAMIEKGIAFNVEQRALLATVSDKVATTFNAFDSTLLDIIRIQQADSTAGRLGMEAAMNAFLNRMYESTEYLSTVASSVKGSLFEMEALMGVEDSLEVEAQVHKWLGSMFSVGMSKQGVESIANSFGQIAAGDISRLGTQGSTSNLIIMAANRSGLAISDILTNGISAENTDILLQNAVEYLADIAESSRDSKVVQQQIANVYGLKASDLRAIANLKTGDTLTDISNYDLTFPDMYGKLESMFTSMAGRMSINEQLANVTENAKYTLANGIGSSPILSTIYQLGGILDSTVGGIPIPAVGVLGNFVDVNGTVSDLIRAGAMGAGIISTFGDIVSGIGNSMSMKSLLDDLGITKGIKINSRGELGGLLQKTGSTVSNSTTFAAQGDGNSIISSAVDDAYGKTKEKHPEVEGPKAMELSDVNETLINIYTLLSDVTNGTKSLSVTTYTKSRSYMPVGFALDNSTNAGVL